MIPARSVEPWYWQAIVTQQLFVDPVLAVTALFVGMVRLFCAQLLYEQRDLGALAHGDVKHRDREHARYCVWAGFTPAVSDVDLDAVRGRQEFFQRMPQSPILHVQRADLPCGGH